MNLDAVMNRAEALLADEIYDPPLTDRSPDADVSRLNITAFALQGLGWANWECRRTKKRTKAYCGDLCMSWCGAFVAYCYLAGGLCLTARAACASTYKLSEWAKKNRARRIGPEEMRAGDIVTVQGPAGLKYGDHIVLVREVLLDGRYRTIEGNAKGMWPDGTRVQGVVTNVRRFEDVVAVYRPLPGDFS